MSCDSIIFAEMIDEETNMAVPISVHINSDMTATLVFDEMPHSLSKVLTKQNPSLLEFEHSTAAVILSVESVNISDAVVISSELNSGSDNDKIEEEDFVTTNFNSQPLAIVTWDTKPEIERHESLSVAPIFSDLEKSGVASSLFDEMPDHSGAFPYSLISEKVAAQYMLLHFPFDPGSVAGRVFDSIEIVFDNSLQLNLSCITPLSTMALGAKSMLPTVGQLLDTMSQPCDHSKMFLHELSAANILTPMVKYERKNGNSSPTDKVFVESFRRIDTKSPWGSIETIANSAIGVCAGHTAICMSKVAGKLWVSEFIQELDMEFGCVVFDTLLDWVISVIFYDYNRAIASFPADFGLPNCKWVDTGQVSDSFDIRQCSQIEFPSKKLHIARILVGHTAICLNHYYMFAICCCVDNWFDSGQGYKADPRGIDMGGQNSANPTNSCASYRILDSFVWMLLDGGPSCVLSDFDHDDDHNILTNLFVADGGGLPKLLVEDKARYASRILSLFFLQSESEIHLLITHTDRSSRGLEAPKPVLQLLGDVHPLIHVLCHRKRREALSHAWSAIESCLLDNLFHPHFICREIVLALRCFTSCHADIIVVAELFEEFCSLLTYAEPLWTLPAGKLTLGIAILSIVAEQLQKVMIVINIFIVGFCATYLKLVLLNGLFPSCGGAYLFKLLAHKVKGATTSFEDGVYGYVPCPESMFATENTTYLATKVTVSYVMSFYTIAMGCDICLLMCQLIYPNSSSTDFFHFTAAKFGVTNSSALLALKSKWDSEPSNKRARNTLQPTLSILAISSPAFSEALSFAALLLEALPTLDIVIDVDYILGDIPRATSSMMGYGSPYHRQVVHSAFFLIFVMNDPIFVNRSGVYTTWFSRKLGLPNFLLGVIFCVLLLLPTSSTGWGYCVLCKLSEDQQYLVDWMSCCCGGTNEENMQSYGQELNFFSTSTSPWKWAFMQGFTMLLQNRYQRKTIYIHTTVCKAKGMNVVWEEPVGVLILQTIFTGFTNDGQKLALNLEDIGDMNFIL
ncbi:hypothetical protein A4A49_09683 [Nicotiana attenuata]|uniref:PATROL1-like C-terminal domain-containing protein n=1 Tax=Nicotiana attenuata TaxID=49451 RepID=A0A1J6HX86_NICAT|nr:hypothetical protein A4A49_09683 [Nicotiana attenuata]